MAKRKKKPEEGGAGFLTTYADIVTLLMAFFVMLFAISSVEEQKFLALLEGLSDAFGNDAYQEHILSGGASILGANQPAGSPVPTAGGAISIVPDQNVADLLEIQGAAFVDQTVELIPGAPRVEGDDNDEGGSGNAEVPTVANVLDLTELVEVQEALIDAAKQAGLDDNVTAEIRARGLVVVLSADDILFRSGSSELEPGVGIEFIGTIASVVGDIDNPIHIEGHTDDVPLDRVGYSNWNLSADRAIAVLNVLADDYGVGPHRLQAVGHGEAKPRIPNVDDESRAVNRRVEIVVAVDDSDAELVIVPQQAGIDGEGT